jgi:hypothetical protein
MPGRGIRLANKINPIESNNQLIWATFSRLFGTRADFPQPVYPLSRFFPKAGIFRSLRNHPDSSRRSGAKCSRMFGSDEG